MAELAPRCENLALSMGYPEYQGVASGLQCWAAWEQGRSADVERLANEALEYWDRSVMHYPLYSLCLWPLVAARLASGRVVDALEAGRQLLTPSQHRLPEELEALVQLASDSWEQGKLRLARQNLTEAVGLAQRLHLA